MNKVEKRICVIVPCYNESGSILNVINEIKSTKIPLDIVVVNDGSTDTTSNVLSKIINRKSKITALTHSFNLGIGGAVQTGLKYAFENNYDVAVQIDGDGQHDPKYLGSLVKSLNGYDMVIGSRYIRKTSYKTPFMRLVGIKLFSLLIKIICGIKVYDTTSGYRVFGHNTISYFAHYYPQEFPEPLSIISFIKNGFTLKEIPVETRQRVTGQSSVTFFYSIYLMLSICIAIIFETFTVKEYD